MIIIENNDKQYNTTIQRALDCINKRNGISEVLEQPNGLDFGGYACGGISLNMVDLSLEGLNLSEIYRTLKIFSKLDEAKKNIIKYEPNKRELSKYISGAMDYISKNKNTLKVSDFTELESKMKSFVSLLNS